MKIWEIVINYMSAPPKEVFEELNHIRDYWMKEEISPALLAFYLLWGGYSIGLIHGKRMERKKRRKKTA